MKRFRALILLALFLIILSAVSPAQAYPSAPVTLVVPWDAGGGTDIVARMFAPRLEEALGVPVRVENRGGSSGAIGTQYVHDAPADGHTLLFSADTPGTFQVMGISPLGYGDFTPISMLVSDPKLVVVRADSPYRSMQDLVDAICERPGRINMAYSGPGGSGHVQGLLYAAAGLAINQTPLGGGSAQILSVLSGQSDFTNPSGSTVLGYLQSGELRALCVFEMERIPGYDAPPITSAIPELAPYMPLTFPLSLHVAKGTPDDIVAALREATAKALASDAWQAYLAENYLTDLRGIAGDDAAAYLARWTSIVSWLLYDSGNAAESPEAFGIARYAP